MSTPWITSDVRRKRWQGKMSLGVEESTEVLVTGGLRVTGDWYQSDPQDFSQPELRWYSYGFEGRALLAAQVERTGDPAAEVTVRGAGLR